MLCFSYPHSSELQPLTISFVNFMIKKDNKRKIEEKKYKTKNKTRTERKTGLLLMDKNYDERNQPLFV